MRWPLLAGAGLILGLGVFAMTTKKAAAAPLSDALDPLFAKWGEVYGVDPLLLKAHAVIESSLNPKAVNRADPSYGVMQVLCTAGKNGRCGNRFNIEGWEGMTAEKLLDPDTNIRMAAQIVEYNIREFGMPRAVAVYNSWSERTSPPGGPFGNQRYVDKVLAVYQRLQGAA